MVTITLIGESLTETRDGNYYAYCQAVTKVEAPTASELEELSNKKAKTIEERHRERKGNLIKRYGTEVTPLLVEKDDNDWYPQLQLQYYLTVGNKYLTERDRRSLSQMKKQGSSKIFKPDVSKRQLSTQIKALQLIGIEQFLDPDAEFTKDSLANWFDERILKQKFGLKLEFKHQIRRDGKRVRVYQGCNINPDSRSVVLNNWLERDRSLISEQGVTPFPNNIINTEGVTAA